MRGEDWNSKIQVGIYQWLHQIMSEASQKSDIRFCKKNCVMCNWNLHAILQPVCSVTLITLYKARVYGQGDMGVHPVLGMKGEWVKLT